ncbi:hypothetical protein RCL1_002697 [Eukaryota sp. TZLM3-RCL]
MPPSGDWDFSEFHDGTSAVPLTVKKEEFVSLLDEHSTKLKELERLWQDSTTVSVLDSPDLLTVPLSDPISIRSFDDLCASDITNIDTAVQEYSLLAERGLRYLDRAQSYFFPRLSLIPERVPSEISLKTNIFDGEYAVDFANTLPFYQELLEFTESLSLLCTDLLEFTANLFTSHKTSFFAKNSVRTPFRFLARLLSIFASIDLLVLSDNAIADDLVAIKKVLHLTVRSTNPTSLVEGVETKEQAMEKLMEVGKLVSLLEGEVLGGKSLALFLNRNFDLPSLNICNPKFLTEFFKQARSFVEDVVEKSVSMQSFFDSDWIAITSRFQSVDSMVELIDGRDSLSAVCLLAFAIKLTKSDLDSERKSIKILIEGQKSMPLIHIYGKVVSSSVSFLFSLFPENAALSPLLQESNQAIKSHTQRLISPLIASSIKNLTIEVALTAQNLTLFLTSNQLNFQRIQETWLKTLSLVYHTRSFLVTCVFLFPFIQQALPRTVLPVIAALSANISTLRQIFVKFHPKFSSMAPFLFNYLAKNIILDRLVNPIVVSSKGKGIKPPPGREDLYGVALNAQITLSGPLGQKEMIVSSLILESLAKSVGDVALLRSSFASLSTFLSFFSTCSMFTNLDFLFSVRELIPPVINSIVPDQVKYLHGFVANLSSSCRLINQSRHLSPENQSKLLTQFKSTIVDALSDFLIKPMAIVIEEVLRIRVATLNSTAVGNRPEIEQEGQLSKSFSVQSVVDILTHHSELFIFGEDYNIKQLIEHRLSTLFHDLIAITPYDYRTYLQMSNFANQRFGLDISPSFLPFGTVDHGMDLLQVVRHLQVFVRKFHYDLHQQNFIEKVDMTKRNVNVIGIEQVSNSIRTHGIGITHSTINLFYTFLTKKLLLVSQFLYDDHVKSRLMRTAKFWSNILSEKGTINAEFELKEAESLLRDVRSLGRSESDGVSYFDKFRELITEIGNALGFVRLLRSGALSHTASNVQFLPNFEDIENFVEMCNVEDLTVSTKMAVDLLKGCIENLSENFTSSANYLGLLAKVFQSELQNDKNRHLKNFYLLAPALIVSHVEFMSVETEKLLMKKGRSRAVTRGLFVSDGFALGLVYLLVVLNQLELFNSLQFFSSVQSHFVTELRSKNDAAQALKVSQEDRQKQFKVVELALNASKLFYSL